MKKIILSALCLLVMAALVAVPTNLSVSYAQGNDIPPQATEPEIEPCLFTNITLGLKGGDGKVWATASNDFTLFPSTVNVVIQLYSSLSYCEDYKEMELMAMNSTLDLDMNTEIVAESSTGGEQRFWIGRTRYRENSGSWKELIVGPLKYSASGEFLGLT